MVPVIGADQIVYACHNKAYDKSGAIGSICHRSFKEFWYSEDARQVFENLDPARDCRHQCANDGKNLFIRGLVETNIDNFV